MRNGPIPPGDFTAAMIELALRIHREGVEDGALTKAIITRIARAVMSGVARATTDELNKLQTALLAHDRDAYQQGFEAVSTLRQLPF